MNNKFSLPALALLALSAVLPSCHNKADQEQIMRQDSLNTELSDSLITANAEKDSLIALLNEISDGMTQIKAMEDIVSVTNLSGETADRKRQLSNDVAVIQEAIRKNKARLAELEKRLQQSTSYNNEMKKSIENLKAQLNEQQATIASLKDQLAKAHITIDNLNRSVDSLNVVNTEVRNEKNRAEEENVRLADELNTCFYVVGTNSELKKNKIIEKRFLGKTRILEGDFEKSYFTQADKRTLTVIPLHSKKAQVMSKHPSGSYELIDNNGQKVLRITNASRFWELGNYLVIKVD